MAATKWVAVCSRGSALRPLLRHKSVGAKPVEVLWVFSPDDWRIVVLAATIHLPASALFVPL